MRRWVLLLVIMWTSAAPVGAQKAGQAPPSPSGPKKPIIPGFTLKKTNTSAQGVVELWERSADRAQLRVETIPGADEALAERRLNAVNAKIPKTGVKSEELMFRFATTADEKAWTNYRATHHITFKTYRFWKLRNGKLVMADFTFPGALPNTDSARAAFIGAKRAAYAVSP